MSKVGSHLLQNPGHTVNWEILISKFTKQVNKRKAKQVNKRKTLEAFYIRTFQPTLNNKLNTKRTLLFRNGIT